MHLYDDCLPYQQGYKMLTEYPFQVSSGAKPIDTSPFMVHGVMGSGSGSGSGPKVCICILSALSFELCCAILDFNNIFSIVCSPQSLVMWRACLPL